MAKVLKRMKRRKKNDLEFPKLKSKPKYLKIEMN